MFCIWALTGHSRTFTSPTSALLYPLGCGGWCESHAYKKFRVASGSKLLVFRLWKEIRAAWGIPHRHWVNMWRSDCATAPPSYPGNIHSFRNVFFFQHSLLVEVYWQSCLLYGFLSDLWNEGHYTHIHISKWCLTQVLEISHVHQNRFAPQHNISWLLIKFNKRF